jgi:hypothetical protein
VNLHADVEWPSFPASTAGSKEAIDTRLKCVVAEFKTQSQVTSLQMQRRTIDTAYQCSIAAGARAESALMILNCVL